MLRSPQILFRAPSSSGWLSLAIASLVFFSLGGNSPAQNYYSSVDDSDANTRQSWAERQAELTGIDPLLCPNCDQPLTFVGMLFGNWQKLQDIFDTAGKDASIAPPLLKPGE